MKKTFSLLAISLCLIIFSSSNALASEMDTEESIQKFAENFIVEDFSDFRKDKTEDQKNVSSEAFGLLQHMDDREEVAEFKEKLLGRELKLKNLEVFNQKVEPVDTKTWDVLMDF